MKLSTSIQIVVAVLAVGCSDSSYLATTGGDAEMTADLAVTAGENAAADYRFLLSAGAEGTGGSFDIAQSDARATLALGSSAANLLGTSCSYNSATQRFECTLITRNGRTFTRSYQLFDSEGNIQSAYDKETTASINVIAADTGAILATWNGTTFADTVSRHRNATVSGLEGDPDTVHTWDGSGTSHIKFVREGQIKRTYELTSNDTITAVRFRQPRLVNPYPLSGTLTMNTTVTRTADDNNSSRTITRRIVITFNGTNLVDMTVNGVAYTLNLATGEVTRTVAG